MSGNRNRRGVLGLVVIFLIVLGDLIVGFADSPGKPNTFTRLIADSLYCHITGDTPGCATVYCPTITNPNYLIEYACTSSSGLCFLNLTKSTTTTISSTSFTNIISGAAWVDTATGNVCGNEFAWCTATFNFNINSILAGNFVQFKIADTTFAVSSNIYQVDDSAIAVAGSNIIGSITWFNSASGIAGDTIALQGKVSVGTTTLSVIKADMHCVAYRPTSGAVG